MAIRGQLRRAAGRPAYTVADMARRIALVEDDPAIRANYAEALRKHGYEVAAYAARANAAAGNVGMEGNRTDDVVGAHTLFFAGVKLQAHHPVFM